MLTSLQYLLLLQLCKSRANNKGSIIKGRNFDKRFLQKTKRKQFAAFPFLLIGLVLSLVIAGA